LAAGGGCVVPGNWRWHKLASELGVWGITL
jgi:hypothetical protein